jgi:hypothetical protein
MVSKFNTNEIDINLLDTQNYTTIEKTDLNILKTHINDYLDDYIENVFLVLETNTNESDETIIKLLNNQDINLALKPKIIDKNQTLIKDISLIKDVALQLHIIQNDKIVISWENLLNYYKDISDFNLAIVEYIDSNYNFLKLKRIDTKFDENKNNIVGKFTTELINSEISNDAFYEIAINNCLPYYYDDVKIYFENLSKEKMAVFIQKKNIFKFTIVNYNFIKEKFNDLLISFLEVNADLLIKELDKYTLENATIYKLLISQKLNSLQKLIIFKTITETVYNEDANICYAVGILLFENQKTPLDYYGILKPILQNTKNTEQKIVLYNLYCDDIPKSELRGFIEILGEPYSDILKGKRPKFANNKNNLEFIKKNKGDFITKITNSNDKFIAIATKKMIS